LPEDGIKVFASQLHTHLTGRRAYTKHYRNGIELPELNRDNHYSHQHSAWPSLRGQTITIVLTTRRYANYRDKFTSCL